MFTCKNQKGLFFSHSSVLFVHMLFINFKKIWHSYISTRLRFMESMQLVKDKKEQWYKPENQKRPNFYLFIFWIFHKYGFINNSDLGLRVMILNAKLKNHKKLTLVVDALKFDRVTMRGWSEEEQWGWSLEGVIRYGWLRDPSINFI